MGWIDKQQKTYVKQKELFYLFQEILIKVNLSGLMLAELLSVLSNGPLDATDLYGLV